MVTQAHTPTHGATRECISLIWESNMPQVTQETFLPEGIIEIVFNLSDPMQGILPQRQTAVDAPACFLQGCYTHAIKVQYSGKHHLFGIRLHHYMVQPLLGIQPAECKNILIDLSLIRPEIHQLWYRLMEADGFYTRVSIIENEFPRPAKEICTRSKYLCGLNITPDSPGYQSIDAISREVCYSTRQLNRKVNSLFGVSAEEWVIQKKFQQAVQLMHGAKRTLTDIAYSSGFYDQAHFCRTFKNFTGLTAKQYQMQKSEVPFHLFA